jgi:hypothetical protein
VLFLQYLLLQQKKVIGFVMKKRSKIIIAVIAALLVTVIAGTLVITSRYLYGGPVFSLLLAAKRTVTAQSLTVQVEGAEVFEMRFITDKESKDQTYLFVYDYGTLVYEDQMEYYLRSDHTYGYADRVNRINQKRINIHHAAISGKKLNMKDAFEAFCYLDVDEKAANRFIKELYLKGISSEKWLREYLGFSKDGNTYNFVIGNDSIKEILRIAEDTELITEKSVEKALDLIKKLNDFTIDASVTVEGGKINNIELSHNGTSIKITLSDYNTTVIERDHIDEIINKAKELD